MLLIGDIDEANLLRAIAFTHRHQSRLLEIMTIYSLYVYDKYVCDRRFILILTPRQSDS